MLILNWTFALVIINISVPYSVIKERKLSKMPSEYNIIECSALWERPVISDVHRRLFLSTITALRAMNNKLREEANSLKKEVDVLAEEIDALKPEANR